MKKTILLLYFLFYINLFSLNSYTFLIEKNGYVFAYPQIIECKNGNLFLSYLKRQNNYNNLYLVIFSSEKGIKKGKFLPTQIKNKIYYTFGFIPYVILKISEGKFFEVEALAHRGIYFHKFSFTEDKFTEILIDKAKKYRSCHCPSITFGNGKLFLVYLKEDACWFTKYENGKWENPQIIPGTESKSFPELGFKNEINIEMKWAQPYLAYLKNKLFLFIGGKLFYSRNMGEKWKIIKNKFGRKSISNKYNRLISDNERIYFFYVEKKVKEKEMPVFVEGFEKGYCEIRSTSSKNGLFWSFSKIVNDTKLPYKIKIGGIHTPTKEVLFQETMEPEILDVKFSSDKKILGILWRDWRDNNPKIYFSYSENKGKTWSKNICVVSDKNAKEGSFFIDGKKLFIFWSKVVKITEKKYITNLYLTKINFRN